MSRLLREIRAAVRAERYLVSLHADERCEERGVVLWQLIEGVDDAVLVRETPNAKPHPRVRIRQMLADGSDVEVVWAWLSSSRRAKLVTVFFPE